MSEEYAKLMNAKLLRGFEKILLKVLEMFGWDYVNDILKRKHDE